MRLTDLLRPEQIVLNLRAGDKAQTITEIANWAAAHLPIETSTLHAALAMREALRSTGFGRGFALPHIRLAGFASLFGVLVRLAKPIEYDAIDQKPVDVIFLLLIPVDKATEHVKALATVSRSMREKIVMKMVREAGSGAALFDALRAAGH
jgi:PTS system nitrogen regulatory IIA component